MQLPDAGPTGLSFRDQRPFWVSVLLSAIVLSVGWRMFAARLIERDGRAETAEGDVSRIWGGPLMQPQPRVQWRRADAATVELSAGEMLESQVAVTLDAEYRRRGVTEFPGYRASFDGRYSFKNPADGPAFVAFSVGLPAERNALMLEQLKLLIDGKEDAEHTEYSPDRIVWTGQLAAKHSREFVLRYEARGLERFSYLLTPKAESGAPITFQPISNFELSMLVRGARGTLDYPTGAMSPTQIGPVEGGTRLSWKVDRLLTAFDVGVVLADTKGVTAALGKLIRNASYFYLLFAAGLAIALRGLSRRARPIHALGLSAAYFLYFPLASYLVAYLPWPIAAALALALIGTISILHVLRFCGARTAMGVGLCQLFFLAAPAAAYLVPTHTGLILVLAGLGALTLGLHTLGGMAERFGHEDRLRDDLPATPAAVRS